VFVGDSTPTGFAADRSYLSGLQAVLERLSGPPVGIVFQANKRDHADAVPIATVRSMLADLDLRVGVVESIATESSGIREAFVFAVRLALDRVRDLMRTGELPAARPEVDSAQELLEDLKRVEDGSMDYAALTGLVHTRLADLQPDTMLVKALAEAVGSDGDDTPVVFDRSGAMAGSDLTPATPDNRVASGLVWPPVDGRLILHELAQANLALTRSAAGDWSAVSNGRWRMHSASNDVFEDLEDGRTILVQAARSQAATREKTASCCIALAADGHGRYRLWRIERIS